IPIFRSGFDSRENLAGSAGEVFIASSLTVRHHVEHSCGTSPAFTLSDVFGGRRTARLTAHQALPRRHSGARVHCPVEFLPCEASLQHSSRWTRPPALAAASLRVADPVSTRF